MNESTPYKLYGTCLLTRGYARSTICDLERGQVYPIPNILLEILQNKQLSTISAVKLHYGEEHSEAIDDYFTFLLNEELIFFTKTPEQFPALSLQWHHPSKITNAIIDISVPFAYDVESVLQQLDELGCRKIEIRCYDYGTPEVFSDLLKVTQNSVINSIGIVTRFHVDIPDQAWQELCDKYARITSITLHGCPQCREITSSVFLTPIRLTSKFVGGAHCCGVIHEDYFTSLIEPVSEAQHFNSCLNRKIGIDLEGNIKNCPSMSESFGHVGTTPLVTALGNDKFKSVWNINKDQINICCDCEFRYICSDCRAYIEDPSDMLSKPLKCGYDPYTCTWDEWNTNPIKKDAIKFYQLNNHHALNWNNKGQIMK